jgi:drug/metabolite transporter (DMT)-like permease
MNDLPTRTKVVGIAAGLSAASIAALYIVFAQWGIARGMQTWDLTFLRFGVAGLVMLPVLALAFKRDRQALVSPWRLWLLVSLLAGPLFGLLMFGAMRFTPPSHSAVFPFAAMSVMGMVLGAVVLGESLSIRKMIGIGIVLSGLVLISGIQLASFNSVALLGDALFVLAGSLWAGFGIVLRKNKLNPVLTTAVISLSALVSYVPIYLSLGGWQRLTQLEASTLIVEGVIQGLIAGVGTLYTYSKTVSLLGASRAAVFPALAPGLATLFAWPVLNHVPTSLELLGTVVVITGLLVAVTTGFNQSLQLSKRS